jgi:hypothetical protein
MVEKQNAFLLAVADLIQHVHNCGLLMSGGSLYRTKEEAERMSEEGKGIRNSLHCLKLAIDLNLFRADGSELKTVEEFRPIGEWWKEQSTEEYPRAWGGDFHDRPDAYHFSFAHEGVR